MSKQWFSATLRFYVISATEGLLRGEDSVYLTRGVDMEEAFKKFLAIGRREETSYKNGYGQEVKKRFAAVTLMDCVGDVDLDGVEISCTPLFEEGSTVTFATPLDPENSVPEHTGIMPAGDKPT